MRNLLAESFAILRPAFPPALFTPAATQRLWQTAPILAPTRLVGFECRLAAEDEQVDIQQSVSAQAGEGAVLLEHIEGLRATASTPLPSAWQRLEAFCYAWSGSDAERYQGIDEILLEYDAVEPIPEIPVPSIFLGLQGRSGMPPYRTTEKALALLAGQSLPVDLLRNLQHCFEAVPEAGCICHAGLMLARPTDAVRVNVYNLSLPQACAYLEAVAWPGAIDAVKMGAVEPILAPWFALADEVRICLDVGSRIYPTLGLECFLEEGPDVLHRWASLLDALVAHHACAPAKRDALLAWPGYTSPLETTLPWPTALLARALTQPPHRLGVLARRLNHVKVSYRPQEALPAKAYLLCCHAWLEPQLYPRNEDDPR